MLSVFHFSNDRMDNGGIELIVKFKGEEYHQLMENDLTCPLCSKEYKDDNLPRLLTLCGHTYCENCIKSLLKPETS